MIKLKKLIKEDKFSLSNRLKALRQLDDLLGFL